MELYLLFGYIVGFIPAVFLLTYFGDKNEDIPPLGLIFAWPIVVIILPFFITHQIALDLRKKKEAWNKLSSEEQNNIKLKRKLLETFK